MRRRSRFHPRRPNPGRTLSLYITYMLVIALVLVLAASRGTELLGR